MNETKKLSPKDVFLHILSIGAMWASAAGFITLCFQYINKFIPDALSQNFYSSGVNDSIRWGVASLTVIFPAFVYISWLLEKSYAKNQEKRSLKTRRWLIYFTIFAASIVLIGDLVVLIYNFLNGDLSIKFILKIIIILFVAGSVFFYYLWNIRNEKSPWLEPKIKIFIIALTGIVIIATLSGYFVAGSPFRERMRKFDERRVSDLQSIQWQIVNYWQKKEKLPDSLDALRDDISGFSAPQDPETGLSYEYQKLGDVKFELCADFKLESPDDRSYPKLAYPEFGNTSDNWSHATGKKCFERNIDPELYPTLEKRK